MKVRTYLLPIFALIVSFSLNAQTVEYKFKPTQNYVGITNTGDNMTVGIPEYAWETPPEIGDEIGAFNQIGQLVGSTVYLGGNCALTIWGDDETTQEKEGVGTGKNFQLRIWHQDDGSENIIEVENWLEGDDLYRSNGISVVDKLKVKEFALAEGEYLLEQNVPNPAQLSTKISYSIPVDATVKIELYTTEGKLLKEIISESKNAGKYTVDVNLSDVANGTYYYKLSTTEFSATKAMNVVK